MITDNNKTCAVIGSGIAGLAACIRMRNKGYRVDVYEANSFPGGKLSSETSSGYRFDLGPSVLTMPEYLDELFRISGKDPREYFSYSALDPVYRYFFEDGTVLDAFHDKEKFASEMAAKTTDSKEAITRYLDKAERIYELTAEVFLHHSLHRLKNYFTRRVANGLLNFGKIAAFDTMNAVNERSFSDPRLVQLFNRYATYNGSSPYLSPATLNLIAYVEIVKGAYYPAGGMHSITRSLVQLAKEIGVNFRFSTPVRQILLSGKKATGVKTDDGDHPYDVVISNMDIYNSYQTLLPSVKKPWKILNQPKSSSGIIFYWGVKNTFKETRLHNIFFSADYREEFDAIFNSREVYADPTIYLNVSCKQTPTDAPPGCENWFVFVNVPHNSGQDWDQQVNLTRGFVFEKLNRNLKIDLHALIETEMVLEPRLIESRTSSAFGSIYGNSSNNRFAAFLRHPNFSREVNNLFFCGGSVHPGASIPLCLLSAKIATGLVR
jgi:phytoene desaturase